MLSQVDLKRRITKEEYDVLKDELVDKLVRLQQECIREKLPVVVCVDGWSAAGKGTTLSKLVKDLDARAFTVYPMHRPTELELRYPLMKRYWERLGQYGTMTFFGESWYSEINKNLLKTIIKKNGVPLPNFMADTHDDYVVGSGSSQEMLFAESAKIFESQLVADGYLIIKCFFHISKKEQTKRLNALQADSKTAWRVTEEDLFQNENYDKCYGIIDKMLELTDYADMRWHVIAANNTRVRRIEFMQALVDEIEEGLARRRQAKENPIIIPAEYPLPRTRHTLVPMPDVEDIRHDLMLEQDEYREMLKIEQAHLSKLQSEMYYRRIPMMLVFEGWDAAGKGGAIKRIASALDARDYRVVPSAAPTVPEKEHPFLWRYWMNLPKSGHAAIYDRSWYGRVMVERIEGFCTDSDWRRAFEEINDFEWEMFRTGALMLKFWVNVGQDEQLARFEARKADPDKAWKLTDEDWRNREKYPEYCAAINDMLRLTSTDYAPWHIIESDDKKYARIKTLKIINEAIEERLSWED